MELTHYFGILRRVNGTWQLLEDAGHLPLGFTGVTVNGSGHLQVAFPAAQRVGVCTVTTDETWWSLKPRASVGLDKIVIITRDAAGNVVDANGSAFNAASGNLWVDLWVWN